MIMRASIEIRLIEPRSTRMLEGGMAPERDVPEKMNVADPENESPPVIAENRRPRWERPVLDRLSLNDTAAGTNVFEDPPGVSLS
jgi:hypothetical protein